MTVTVGRERVLALRLEPGEHAAWTAACASSPWRSLAHWCREVITDALGRSEGLAVRSQLAVVSGADGERFAGLCAGLNADTWMSHRLGRVLPTTLTVAGEIGDAADWVMLRSAVAGWTGTERGVVRPARSRLVNVRLSAGELAGWEGAATAAGHARCSGWARAMIAHLVGYDLPPEPVTVPTEYVGLRKNLAGAVGNLAQLASLAEDYDPGLAEQVSFAQYRAQAALEWFHLLRRRR